MNRPTLKIGDVVRLSKSGRGARRMYAGHVMVVEKFMGDTSDGRTRIECSTFQNGIFSGKVNFKRRELWYTGYNSQAKTNANNVITQKINRNDVMGPMVSPPTPNKNATNDGRTNCMSCKQPTRFVPGFGSSGYNLCKNKSCSMYDR